MATIMVNMETRKNNQPEKEATTMRVKKEDKDRYVIWTLEDNEYIRQDSYSREMDAEEDGKWHAEKGDCFVKITYNGHTTWVSE